MVAPSTWGSDGGLGRLVAVAIVLTISAAIGPVVFRYTYGDWSSTSEIAAICWAMVAIPLVCVVFSIDQRARAIAPVARCG